jgi:hypothetical protein
MCDQCDVSDTLPERRRAVLVRPAESAAVCSRQRGGTESSAPSPSGTVAVQSEIASTCSGAAHEGGGWRYLRRIRRRKVGKQELHILNRERSRAVVARARVPPLRTASVKKKKRRRKGESALLVLTVSKFLSCMEMISPSWRGSMDESSICARKQ